MGGTKPSAYGIVIILRRAAYTFQIFLDHVSNLVFTRSGRDNTWSAWVRK